MPLYIAKSGDLDRCYRCLTDWLTTLKDRATQLLIKYKSGALVTKEKNCCSRRCQTLLDRETSMMIKMKRKKWILFLSLTLLNWEAMDEDNKTKIKQDNQNDNDNLVSDPLEPGDHGWGCCSCGRESSPPPRRPSQTPDVFDHRSEACNPPHHHQHHPHHLLHLSVHLKHLMSLIIVLKLLIKIIVSISSTSASVNVRKSHLKKSYSIMSMTITTAGFIIVSTITIVIFIIITLLPMSLILVLKLAISRTESAISPVAKFCTTWWTHHISRPLSSFFQEFCSSLLSFVRSFFVSTMKLGSKIG